MTPTSKNSTELDRKAFYLGFFLNETSRCLVYWKNHEFGPNSDQKRTDTIKYFSLQIQ